MIYQQDANFENTYQRCRKINFVNKFLIYTVKKSDFHIQFINQYRTNNIWIMNQPKQKIVNYHKKIRREAKQLYFLQCRSQLLQTARLPTQRCTNYHTSHLQFSQTIPNRNIISHHNQTEFHIDQQWSDYQQRERYNQQVFPTRIDSLDEAQYYLNFFMEEAQKKSSEDTFRSLECLLHRILGFKASNYQSESLRINLIYSILKAMKQILVNTRISQSLRIKRERFWDIMEDDIKLLLQKEDNFLLTLLLDLSYQLAINQAVPPNYYIIKHILVRNDCFGNQIKHQNNWTLMAIPKTVQQLLKTYIQVYKINDNCKIKLKNIPYQQVICDYMGYIEAGIAKINDLLKNNRGVLHQEQIQDHLGFYLRLYIVLMTKFQNVKHQNGQNNGRDILKMLFSQRIINLLQETTRNIFSHRSRENWLILPSCLSETVSMMLHFLINRQNHSPLRRYARHQQSKIPIFDSDSSSSQQQQKISLKDYINEMTTLIRLKLQQMRME